MLLALWLRRGRDEFKLTLINMRFQNTVTRPSSDMVQDYRDGMSMAQSSINPRAGIGVLWRD